MSPALALQKSMRAALSAFGAPVFDHVPQGQAEPYVWFSEFETRDWSTKTEAAHEHFVTLQARTRGAGRKEAQELCDAIETALDGAALTLDGHRLVNLRLTLWSVRREGELYRATLRFRAATEPL